MHRHIPVVQTYGLTEACSQAVTLSPADAMRKIGSAGRPLASVQLRILHDHTPTSPGEPGEIFLKGPTITPGYADSPEATAHAFQDGRVPRATSVTLITKATSMSSTAGPTSSSLAERISTPPKSKPSCNLIPP